MTHYASIAELEAAVGAPPQTSSWLTITQDRISDFADATDDHQWIHVDVERAAAGPYGSTIAHGYLTMSLISGMLFELLTVEGNPTVINYGHDRVRFLNVVRVNSRVRASLQLTAVTPIDSGVRVNSTVTLQIEGESKPAFVAETIALFLFEQ
ncbi:MAG TPA: MaoC family dehydratase [Galbitalea sp.]|nr:MaoC family dehydratase [Galbitalea sp.]